MANLSGNSLFAGIYSGLTNTYSYLAQINPNGVTQDSINKARTDAKNSLNLNQSFASYLQSNFKNIDVDGDGIIGSSEITDYTNIINRRFNKRTVNTTCCNRDVWFIFW